MAFSLAKVETRMPDSTPKPLPGKGLFGWLGRQVGYVTRAVRHPIGRHSRVNDAHTSPTTIFRGEKVLEEPMPGNPQITLRRTVIDEAIVNRDESRP